jgi:hypothetical protein
MSTDNLKSKNDLAGSRSGLLSLTPTTTVKPQVQKSDLDFAFDLLSRDNKRVTKDDITSFYRDVIAPIASLDSPLFTSEEIKKKVCGLTLIF